MGTCLLLMLLAVVPLLQPPQSGVQALPVQQMRMVAALDNAPAVDHEDLVSAHDARQAVRDDESGSIARQAVQFQFDGVL